MLRRIPPETHPAVFDWLAVGLVAVLVVVVLALVLARGLP